MKNKIISTILTLILTANVGLCEQTHTSALHTTVIKFGLAMGGVVLSSLIIYFGLTVYNKFFVKMVNLKYEEDALKTPKTTDEAVKFFIHKNRLR